jgi:hypothetical protein
MPNVSIEPQLYNRIEKAASQQQSSIDQLLDEAVRQYLWEMDRRKISEESRIYRQKHATLKAMYLDKYIAMHEGEVVDHDVEFQPLFQRIREQFGNMPIMIVLVKEDSDSAYVRRGFRQEKQVV